jgi:hypothetical protein
MIRVTIVTSNRLTTNTTGAPVSHLPDRYGAVTLSFCMVLAAKKELDNGVCATRFQYRTATTLGQQTTVLGTSLRGSDCVLSVVTPDVQTVRK